MYNSFRLSSALGRLGIAAAIAISLANCKSSSSSDPTPNQAIKNTTILTTNFVIAANAAELTTNIVSPRSRSFSLGYGYANRILIDWAVGDSIVGKLSLNANVDGIILPYSDLVSRNGKYIIAYVGETTAGSSHPPQRLVVPNFANPSGDSAQLAFLHTHPGYGQLKVAHNGHTLGTVDYGTFATFSGRIKPTAGDTIRLYKASNDSLINSTTVSDVLSQNKVKLAVIRPYAVTTAGPNSRAQLQIVAQDQE